MSTGSTRPIAPGTGTPEAGGLTPREAQAILHGLKGLDIIGGDVVEVAPQYDATTNTAMVGARQAAWFNFCSLPNPVSPPPGSFSRHW